MDLKKLPRRIVLEKSTLKEADDVKKRLKKSIDPADLKSGAIQIYTNNPPHQVLVIVHPSAITNIDQSLKEIGEG